MDIFQQHLGWLFVFLSLLGKNIKNSKHAYVVAMVLIWGGSALEIFPANCFEFWAGLAARQK